MKKGAVLGDRYEILDPIGSGVSAVVYEALDREADRRVALKVLNPHLRADDISIERFRREIQITRHIDHPQIVSIFDFGREGAHGEQLWLAMELLSGSDLKDYIALERPVPLATALSVIEQLLRVLAACHSKNVIHRDLKPQNVFIDEAGRIKLLDFGISRMTTLRDLTQTGTSLGSPEYMAPELFATSTYDPRTDLYAVGVIAFELLAGRLPFQGDSLPVLYHAHLEQAPPDLASCRDDVPEWLQQMIERLLAKPAHERYQSAEEALLDLEAECVAARRLEQPVRRRCLLCDAETRIDLPLCGSCGSDPEKLLRQGDCALHCSRDVDPAVLSKFVDDELGGELSASVKGRTLLLDGLDRVAAQRIKSAATRRRLYMELSPARARRSAPSRIARALGTLFVAWFVAPLAIGVGVGAVGAFLYGLGVSWGLLAWTTVQFLGVCAALISMVGAPFWIAARSRAATPLVQLSARVTANARDEGQWLRELAPRLRDLTPGPARATISGLVDKYARVVDAAPRFAGGGADRLRELLDHAVSLARFVCELAAGFEPEELQELSQRHLTLESDIARLESEGDAQQLAALRSEKRSIAERLRELSELDERRQVFENELTAVQAVFARVLARVLVYEHAMNTEDLELLDESLVRVRRDLDLSREIAKELRAT